MSAPDPAVLADAVEVLQQAAFFAPWEDAHHRDQGMAQLAALARCLRDAQVIASVSWQVDGPTLVIPLDRWEAP